MKKNANFLYIFIFSFFGILNCAYCFDYTEIPTSLSDSFYNFVGENEGTTTFRSLLIPSGGRAESLGGAYIGLSNDVSYIDYNPAASSILKQSEIAVFHNAWIADSAMETISGTTRFGDLGIGGKLSCFYVPFSEYDIFGKKMASNYYSETTLAANISYNFRANYTFKGLATGLNIKTSWRSIPDYCDNDTGEIISASGLEQSALAFMADVGIMLQFNIAKFYISRDTNFRIGLSAANLGCAITGFKSEEGVRLDDGLPSIMGIGFSYKPINQITFSLDFKQPFNMLDFSEYLTFEICSGAEFTITKFFSILTGFQLKGANPRISLGGEIEFFKFRMNINYTLDLTSSLNPINHISLSGKILLGDKGREEKQKRIDILYNEGIKYLSMHDYQNAIRCWEDCLKINKKFDPARTAIKNTKQYQQMLEDYSL